MDFIGDGSVLGVPISFAVLIVVAIVGKFVMTRLRIGWRIAAVGGSRRAAYNAGIPVRRTVCLSYIVSGMLTGLAGVLYAARLSGVGPHTGVGLELSVVTAALLGGNSIGGGRGSIGKALMGAIIVSLLFSGLVRLGLETGAPRWRPASCCCWPSPSTCGGAYGERVSNPRSMCRPAIWPCRRRRPSTSTRLRPTR